MGTRLLRSDAGITCVAKENAVTANRSITTIEAMNNAIREYI
jgi:hypothetical protein